jgi:hypothetical protein
MRFAIAVASTLTLLLAAPAAAQYSSAGVTSGEPGLYLDQASFAGWIGAELGDGDGFYLRADGAVPIWEPIEGLQLKGVVNVGFTHFGEEVYGVDVSTNIFKVLASARAQYALLDELDLFVDLGLGFYLHGTSVDGGGSDSGGGGTMRIATGAFYEVAPQMKVGAELGFNPYFGDVDTTEFLIGAGFEYSL